MPRKAGTGCVTCRIRRVKCDETKPYCRRCIASKRQCDGYLPDSSTVTRRQLADAAQQLGSVRSALSQSPQHRSRSSSPGTISAFDLFRHSTAPASSSLFPSDFWTTGLLQLAHTEPAAWHAVLALGTLHHRWELEDAAPEDVAGQEALKHQAIESYGLAVSQARDLTDPPKLLALCLSFIAVANLLGNWDEARIHITSGLRLMTHAGSSDLAKSAGEILGRLDLQAMTYSDSTAPYPWNEAAWLSQADRDWQRTERITSYSQASTALFALLRRALLFDEALVIGTLREYEQGPRAHELFLDLCRWEAKINQFELQHPERGPWAIAIRLYHVLLRLVLRCTAFGPETRWDQLLGYFELILSCCELLAPSHSHGAPRLSLEMGLAAPLYIVAANCRHPYMRRRAVNILERLNNREGKWMSLPAAIVAKKVIAIEEQTDDYVYYDLPPSSPASDFSVLTVPWEAWAIGSQNLPTQTTWEGIHKIPEGQRVKETMIVVALEKRRINLTTFMSSTDPSSKYGEMREHVAYF